MVIIQPATDKIVLVYDKGHKHWFLPKGRKDVGETLEQAALREAYEESGYQVQFLPLYTPSHAPYPPSVSQEVANSPNTEPIFISTRAWSARRRGFADCGGEYLTFWYVGCIEEDANREEGTGMPDEQDYESHLVDFETAGVLLASDVERRVLNYAWAIWMHTRTAEEESTGPKEQG